MAGVTANGITIEYGEAGNKSDPAIMLIRGVGTQLIDWPPDFIRGLVDRGFRVIYHDNRDVGLSEKFEEAGLPDIRGAMEKLVKGEPIHPPYTLEDMALDVVGLQDALGIGKAHIVGISMGGAIVQILAALHSERIRSLIAVMSSSGNPEVSPGSTEALKALTSAPENPNDRDCVIAHIMEVLRIIGSKGYPEDEETRSRIATARYDRSYYPAGSARHLLAVLANGSRVNLLKTISVPTLVIHGADDPLVPLAGGKDVAKNIPGAKIEIIEGMGHNFPQPLISRLVDLIAGHAKMADEKTGS